MKPDLFLRDLERKPDVLAHLADALDDGAMSWPVDPSPATVVLIGMGSSLYAAQVAAQRMRAAGLMAVAESGSAERTLTGGENGFVVGISAGGSSAETNRLFADTSDARRVALTNVADAYGLTLPYLRDTDRDGFPDVIDPAPHQDSRSIVQR